VHEAFKEHEPWPDGVIRKFDDVIAVKQQMTDEPLTIPSHRDLRAALDPPPKDPNGYILPTRLDGPYTPEGLSTVVSCILQDLRIAIQ
jgi:hypothetical protein